MKTSNRQHLADIRRTIKALSSLSNPSRLQVQELAEWRAAEKETLLKLRADHSPLTEQRLARIAGLA